MYPEYDKLIADGKISMVQIYGQIEHGDLSPNDWGFSINDVTRTLTSHGFRKTQTFPNNTGHRLRKTMPNGLKVEIDMLSPVSFADHVDREASNAKFREAIKSHEVVYYAGHAFYGLLDGARRANRVSAGSIPSDLHGRMLVVTPTTPNKCSATAPLRLTQPALSIPTW